MADIKAIDKTTVHRICSGQVVLNLAIAVKELVENSLDAGATVIDVRFKEYGSELVEVTDNGSGVHPSNFEGLTLKHHTSKLRDFTDLISVETFGFRGEALSSLCALSELTVVTRHESQPYGTSLVFDRNGHIVEKKQHARQIGTTISLTNLFSTLPVRQKEFHKNLKREFNKMTQLLYAYCLVSTGVKITCVNQTKKGARTTFMSTQGCKTVKENISCIFGAKQLSSLLEINQKNPETEILGELKLTPEDCSMYRLEGYISSCAHGAGRGTNDRQFYYVNSRPCEPSKIVKQVNEVYHQFNGNQYPFVFLNVSVTKGAVDVNVTPDKRQIFLTQEKLLLAIIKASLLDLYEKIPSTYAINGLSSKPMTSSKISETTVKNNLSQFDSWRHKNDKTEGKRRFEASGNDDIPKKQIKIANNQPQKTLDLFSIKRTVVNALSKETKDEIKPLNSDQKDTGILENGLPDKMLFNTAEELVKTAVETDNCVGLKSFPEKVDESSDCQKGDASFNEDTLTVNEMNSNEYNEEANVKNGENGRLSSCSPDKSVEDEPINTTYDSEHHTVKMSVDEADSASCPVMYDEFVERGIKCISISTDLNSIKDAIKKRVSNSLTTHENKTSLRFRATIEPSKNDQAEKELSKEISKDKFEKMDIIGQFNLGFIITKLESDLFIIDQHATDEKYNFETLQKTTVISNQKLVNPQTLELTAANECVLMDNVEVFRKNGFEFDINEEAAPTKRIKLSAVPMSRNWVFGKDDIDELIFMLENCPHGRPTMRHLVNLELINTSTT